MRRGRRIGGGTSREFVGAARGPVDAVAAVVAPPVRCVGARRMLGLQWSCYEPIGAVIDRMVEDPDLFGLVEKALKCPVTPEDGLSKCMPKQGPVRIRDEYEFLEARRSLRSTQQPLLQSFLGLQGYLP